MIFDNFIGLLILMMLFAQELKNKQESSDTFVLEKRSAVFYVDTFLSFPKKMSNVEWKNAAHQNYNYQFWEKYTIVKQINNRKTIIILRSLTSKALNKGITDKSTYSKFVRPLPMCHLVVEPVCHLSALPPAY